ncbi:MAG: methylmalonyl-CoA mutase family protein [Deltaproteobacteria bacterium]|nr:methylmalonyl-CoA mutase family protein [Deltaproteobacteria bacterium]
MIPVRFLTAASLFDGHDAAINVIRRVLQDAGCEVIHLGHNRGVQEIVRAAIQEDVDGIAISSYQGGHNEYFKYLIDCLREKGSSHIQVFGGGGGVILPEEIAELQKYGVNRIFSPDDGMKFGLEGMAKVMVSEAEAARVKRKPADIKFDLEHWGRTITAFENGAEFDIKSSDKKKSPLVLGITGTGGAGKSSLIDEMILRFAHEFPSIKMAIYSVDPSKRKTGGALLGDRIRMNAIDRDNIFMRSLATRNSPNELNEHLAKIVAASKKAPFDFVIVETPGIGQGSSSITEVADLSLYVMTSEYGAATQLEKIDMIDFADFIAINKFDRRGSEDALREVRKQFRRSRKLFNQGEDSDLPVFGTRCNIFNDKGATELYRAIRDRLLKDSDKFPKKEKDFLGEYAEDASIVSGDRVFYLSDIAKTLRTYHSQFADQQKMANEAYILNEASKILKDSKIKSLSEEKLNTLSNESKDLIKTWPKLVEDYSKDEVVYQVRDQDIKVPQTFISLSGLKLKRVTFPHLQTWGEILQFCSKENLPGYFPFVSGIYPFKRAGEEPRRQFAGEGPPEKTNKRFHYLCRNDDAKRLSTAFDSVTLYGEDPHLRPDIYGKVGESGVSIATIDDMAVLYDGFDLCDPMTSVSMTINGPAPMILAMFLNVAIRQQLQKFEKENKRAPSENEESEIKAKTLSQVRGTVQADILKEDQAQNTCIFSTEFALRMMADIQDYFIRNKVRNYYSVSISGYHIAEAGANPITQLAFTLSNGFTLVEYYLARGMKIDDFAPNLSFFFSNGLDPEYSVIGRVARRIWAVAMRDRYGANERSQKLKYHIQTSGRSLHASEIEFNDVRTTLQALTAIYDNCNSLHTNAYDEAITTPTEESVRRAMAIQMIIQKEFGSSKTENFTQGSYVMSELTDLVEEAVLKEFESISRRGGVLGAMETQYQRSKIQEESLYYERLKHSGELPIVGVNTFLPADGAVRGKIPLARSNVSEKNKRLKDLEGFWKSKTGQSQASLDKLQKVALSGGNIFEELMNTVKVCSLGEITKALYEVGGRYRRNM